MRRLFLVLNVIIALSGGVAFAQSGLPPEAQARVLIAKAENALAANDETGALNALGELSTRNLPRPPSTFMLEARLAGRAQDYARVRRVLQAYFNAANPNDADYDAAAQMFAALDDLERQQSEQKAAAARAADAAAWSRARNANTCESLERYIQQASDFKGFGEEALQTRRSLGCPRLAWEVPSSERASVVADSAALSALSLFRDCESCPEMIVIPSGVFLMGSPANEVDRGSDEGPQHSVSISRFAVGRFEITFDDWAACVSGGGCRSNANPEDEGWGRGRQPLINVSWEDAQAYVQWLSRKTGQRYRLLSEAEWEYAARAGTASRWSFGETESRLGSFAWFSGNSGGRAQPVGGKAPNPWGLYDMHGNVHEWVEDCYADTYAGLPTNGAPYTIPGCSYRVLRGGSWVDSAQVLRSADRVWLTPAGRGGNLGFRVARTL